jgi:hypothetical protein
MPKRFIDTDLNRTSMRGVDLKLRFALEWLWQNCDAAGVWRYDPDLFKFEAGYSLNLEGLLKACPRVTQLSNGNLFLLDFVPVNYGSLKPGYNPHKPVFRSLEANGIEPLTLQFEGFTKTCSSLEEEGKEEGEGTQRRKEPVKELVWPPWAGPKTREKWDEFKVYRKRDHGVSYKSVDTEQKALNILIGYFPEGKTLVSALEYSMGKNWQFPVNPSEHAYPGPLTVSADKPWHQ